MDLGPKIKIIITTYKTEIELAVKIFLSISFIMIIYFSKSAVLDLIVLLIISGMV